MIRRPIPILLVLLVAFAAACGPSARVKTLRASLVTVNAARDQLNGYDLERQQAYANRATAATSHEEIDKVEAELGAYRAKREPVFGALIAAYSAIALAATLDDGGSLGAAVSATAKFVKAVDELRKAVTP